MTETDSPFVASLVRGRRIERLIQRCEALGWRVAHDPDRRGIVMYGPAGTTEPDAAVLLRTLYDQDAADYLRTGRPCRLSPEAEQALASPAGLSDPPDLAVPDAPLDGRDRQRGDSAAIVSLVGAVALLAAATYAGAWAVEALVTWWRS